MRNQVSEGITFRKREILLACMDGGNLSAAACMLDTGAVVTLAAPPLVWLLFVVL